MTPSDIVPVYSEQHKCWVVVVPRPPGLVMSPQPETVSAPPTQEDIDALWKSMNSWRSRLMRWRRRRTFRFIERMDDEQLVANGLVWVVDAGRARPPSWSK